MGNRSSLTIRGEGIFQVNMPLFVNLASEDFDLPLHDHDFIEFAYITEGTGFHHIGDQVHEVRKGQLFYIPIGISHVFRPVSSDAKKHPLTVYNCVFSPSLLSKLAGFASDLRIQQFINSIHEGNEPYFYLFDGDDSIEKLFLLLHREYALPKEGTSDYLLTLLLQLLIQITRMKQQIQAQPKRKLSSFDLLLAYMDNHLSEELSLGHLAQISRWSERHLQRLFLQHTSQTYNRYLQSLRIQKSSELLRNTSFKISVIAEMVGYRDMASFLTVFKRIVGMNPSHYRKTALLVP